MKRILLFILFVLLTLNVAAQITSSSIRGSVKSSEGESLVGATVELKHSKTGAVYYAVSGIEGRFAIHGIRPDDGYTLMVEFVGYDSFVREGIVLRLGEVAREDIVLKSSATSLGEVVVESAHPRHSGVTERFDEQAITQLPTVSRSLYDVVRLTPQAVVTKNGGMSYGGVANRYNSFRVNGMANNDMYGLSNSGTNGGLSNANPIALDAIAQIEVAVAPFDVRMSGFGGGEINAVTKSGTNTFAGSAYT